MGNHPHFLWTDLFRREKMSQKPIASALKENILFSTLTPRELSYLSSLVYERVYQMDEPVFRQNERGLGMYVILKGRIAIRTQNPLGENLVTTLSEGSFFGEIALVDSHNIRTASAVAIERTIIVGFFKPDLMEILDTKPSMGVKILYQLSTILCRRLVETTERITQLKRNPKEAGPNENPA
jgi:CRP/FNR family cyclic AMP-dependent transcriptional regulator